MPSIYKNHILKNERSSSSKKKKLYKRMWYNTHKKKNNNKKTRKKRKYKGGEEDNCPICLDDINEYEKIVLKCKHEFHATCIRKLCNFEKNKLACLCPICREKIERETIYPEKIYGDTNSEASKNLSTYFKERLTKLYKEPVKKLFEELYAFVGTANMPSYLTKTEDSYSKVLAFDLERSKKWPSTFSRYKFIGIVEYKDVPPAGWIGSWLNGNKKYYQYIISNRNVGILQDIYLIE